MAHSSEYPDWNHIQDLNAQSLLEAFLSFELPGEVPQGIRQINRAFFPLEHAVSNPNDPTDVPTQSDRVVLKFVASQCHLPF